MFLYIFLPLLKGHSETNSLFISFQTRSDEVLLETFSGDEEDNSSEKTESKDVGPSSETSSDVKQLLTRKLELEKRNRNQELHQQRVMVSFSIFCFILFGYTVVDIGAIQFVSFIP